VLTITRQGERYALELPGLTPARSAMPDGYVLLCILDEREPHEAEEAEAVGADFTPPWSFPAARGTGPIPMVRTPGVGMATLGAMRTGTLVSRVLFVKTIGPSA
jgi:hypothetical protein